MTMLPVNYATEESFNVYLNYLAMKRHFTTDSYDFHKYNGKVKASFDSYQTRNDAFFFYKLSKKKEWKDHILANIIETPNIWIRDLCEESAESVYFDWKKKTDGLTHHFNSQLNKLKPDLQDNFVVRSGSHPYLLNLYMKKQVSREFFTILTNITNVFPYWEEQMPHDVIAHDAIKMAKKYLPFLSIDKKKFATLLKTYVESHKYEVDQ
jgi:hypothetical protein